MAGQIIEQNKATHRPGLRKCSAAREAMSQSTNSLRLTTKTTRRYHPGSRKAGQGARCLPTRSDLHFQISSTGSTWRSEKETSQ